MYPNVLTDYSYTARYYITHPHKFFKEIYYNLKYAWQRITRGWADYDRFSMDKWMIEVLPSMLRDLAEKGHTHPIAKTSEEWNSWLYRIADEIETLDFDYIESLNEHSDKFFGSKERNEELVNKYFERQEALQKEAEQKAIKIFSEIGENFYNLWD